MRIRTILLFMVITLTSNNSAFANHEFLVALKDKISANWKIYLKPRVPKSGQVQVKFGLNSNGTYKNLRLIKSSGSALLDQSLTKAIKDTCPIPPPEETSYERLLVTGNFNAKTLSKDVTLEIFDSKKEK